MFFVILAIVQMTILELMMCRLMCVVLAPRRPRLFVALMLVVWTTRMVMQIQGVNRGPLVVAQLILHSFALPLLFSGRSLPQRAIGMSAIMAAMTFVELVAETLYRITSGGGVFPTSYSVQNYASLYWIYTAMLVVAVPLFELIIGFVRRSDEDLNVSLEWPVVAFLVLAIASTSYWSTRSNLLERATETSTLVTLALIAVQQAIGIALGIVARNDARSQREAARRQVLARQTRHLSVLIGQSSERVMAMRRLRHDLANQVDVVRGLAAQGRRVEADRHLALLQDAAHELAEGLDG